MLFFALWDYPTSIKTATGFTPFCLVHGIESVHPIKCQIPSLFLVVELLPDTSPLEEWLLQLEQTIEYRRASLQAIEAAKTRSKVHYDSHVHPHTFIKGGMVLVYEQPNDKLGKDEFSMTYTT